MKISNEHISKILREIAVYLEMQNVPFKPRAYEKAAIAVADLSEDINDMHKKGGIKAIEEIEGIGASIAEKIEEIIKTGHLKYYDQLKKKTPVDVSFLMSVEGLGPKKIKKLYQELKITNVEELERAARGGKIRNLENFGEKTEENILKSLEFLKSSGGRFILGYIMPDIRKIESDLKKLKEVKKITVAGSVRRRKETIGDVDILIVSDKSAPVMDFFVNMPEVARVVAHGNTKSAVKLKNGLDVDVRVVAEESYGAALNYFTGSKYHNIALREIAMKKGWKLNEYGLFKSAELRGLKPRSRTSSLRGRRGTTRKESLIAGKTEEEIYEKLGLDYIEPEMRENEGEIELSREHKLPKLIGYDDLQGDLQIQTNWTDGANTIEEYAQTAIKKGLKYIAITDHTKRLAMTGGLDEKALLRQIAEIKKISSKLKNKNFRVLTGSEVDILKDGTLDIEDKVLEKLDIVGAAVHSYFNLSKEEQTKRIIRAMENKNVDIIFHPTGRIINRRPAYEVDIDEIIKAAKRTDTVLEIDAFPDRLDLKEDYIRKCIKAGVKLAINSDAHLVSHMDFLEFGIAQARRGWATKNNVINCWPLEKMLKMLK